MLFLLFEALAVSFCIVFLAVIGYICAALAVINNTVS